MGSDSGLAGELEPVGELSPQARATILQRLDALAPSVLSGVDRVARIAVTDGDREVLTMTFILRHGHASFADREFPAGQTVGIGASRATATAVGSGDELLEDAFAAGTLTVERALPDDFRLAPLLESVFEALVDTGVIPRAGDRPAELPAQDRTLSGFADVDASGSTAAMLSCLDVSARELSGLKHRMTAALAATPGDWVLDVGCGAGHEAAEMAARGIVAVGADRSQHMTQATRRRASVLAQRVAVVQADCQALPFGTGTFDGCWIERVLQHVESPARVAAEIYRVVRPGGGVVAFEPDWESMRFDSAQAAVSTAVAAANAMTHRHPASGRHLPGLFTEAGFTDVRCETSTAVWHSLADLERVIPISTAVRRAVRAGTISAAAGAAWTAEQTELSAGGRFRASLDRVVAWVPIA